MNDDLLPAADPNLGKATQAQKDLLIKHGLWKDGTSFEEASHLINDLPSNFMEPGINLVKILKIEKAMKNDKEPRLDKDGFPGVKITFSNPKYQEISDIFYYNPDPANGKKCASGWKLSALKTAMGLSVEKEATKEQYLKIKFFSYVAHTQIIDENGIPILNEDGSEKGYSELLHKYALYRPDATNFGKPAVAGDPAIETDHKPRGIFLKTKTQKPKEPTTVQSSVQSDFDSKPGEAGPQPPIQKQEDW